MKQTIQIGHYRHFRGNLYAVEGLATHSETEETMVVYRPLYGERALWVRPLSLFLEEVEVGLFHKPPFGEASVEVKKQQATTAREDFFARMRGKTS